MTVTFDQQILVGLGLGVVVFMAAMVIIDKRRSPAPIRVPTIPSADDKALHPSDWRKFKLIKKTDLSPNTASYRFELNEGQGLGLPIGQHVSISHTINNAVVQRSYTPTSSDHDRGFFDLVVKAYPTGNISKYFSELKVGDLVNARGPKGQMKYKPGYASNIGMIAGGTGITPMLQIIRAVLTNPADRTGLSLIYANVNEEDILLRAKLDQLAEEYPDRFKVFYVLNNPPANWTGGAGFVTTDMIRERLPGPAKTNKVLLCGPPPMIGAMKKSLAELEFEAPNTISKMPDQVFCF